MTMMPPSSSRWWRALLGALMYLTVCACAEKKKVQHLPLIPHHQASRRRQLLSSSTTSISTSTTSTSTTSIESFVPRYRHRRRSLDAIQVGALYQGYGTHYIDLWVGTPAQRQTLIVDTGSGMSAFPCSDCDATSCGDGFHIDQYFDENKSSSYEKLACRDCQRGQCSQDTCKVGMSYKEGSSWKAFEARDMVYIGGPHDHNLVSDNSGSSDLDPGHAFAFSFSMVFGCQTELKKLFKTQLADGIMGMDDAKTAFWSQMRAAKIISDQKFSLCFARQPIADKEGTEAGAMTMGGYDDRLHSSPMVYTSRSSGGRAGFYTVHVRKMYLRHGSGGESSKSSNKSAQIVTVNVSEDNLNHGNVIVDSGTTDTAFSPVMKGEFKKAFEQLSGGVAYSDKGVILTEAELRALPTILIQIAGDDAYNKELYPNGPNEVNGLVGTDVDPDHPYDVLLAIPPSHYMEYDGGRKQYVNRFYLDSSGGVLGANAMMGHDVYFNVDDKRIGWAESDCNYRDLVTSEGFVDSLVEGGGTSIKPEIADDDHQGDRFAPDNCSDAKCRGITAASVIGFLAVGLAIGRLCRRGESSSSGRYHIVNTDAAGDVELSSGLESYNTEDDGEFQYREDPEGNAIADPEGRI